MKYSQYNSLEARADDDIFIAERALKMTSSYALA